MQSSLIAWVLGAGLLRIFEGGGDVRSWRSSKVRGPPVSLCFSVNLSRLEPPLLFDSARQSGREGGSSDGAGGKRKARVATSTEASSEDSSWGGSPHPSVSTRRPPFNNDDHL